MECPFLYINRIRRKSKEDYSLKKIIVLLVTICLLFTNASLAFATSDQGGTAIEQEGTPDSVTIDETENSNEVTPEPDPIDEVIPTDSSIPIEQPDAISQILSDISVNASVYGDHQPRGKFLIRFNPSVELSDESFNRNSSFAAFSSAGETLDTEQIADLYKVKTFNEINTISMELNVDEVNQLLTNPLIASIEEDKPIEVSAGAISTFNPQSLKSNSQTIPWGIHSTGSYLALTKGAVDLSAIKVAVFDTGISNHSDLQISGGASFVENTSDYWDDHGHGTHIAGTIAAINNEQGVVGAAAGVQLYSVKVMDSTGYGYTSSVLQGIQWAIDNEIDIINMSFTSSQYSEALSSAIQLAKNSGILIIAAAGNLGAGENTIQYPALYPEVIAVGAVDSSHHRAGFSSTGVDLDFVAPGYAITSTIVEGSYGTTSGTSSAAAHVSAAAAWVWASNPSFSADDVIQLMKTTATPLGDTNEYGSGLVNIARAINIINGSIAPLSDENLSGISPSLPPSTEGDITIASYDKINDGATVEVGDSVTVSLKLEGDKDGNNPHSKIIVDVYSPFNPNSIIDTYTINNPQLHQTISYQWNVPINLPTGTYYIKYRYPDLISNEHDDLFVIYVIQSGFGPDTYEPNDTYVNAKFVSPENSYISYVSSGSDIDKYQFIANQAGKIDIDLEIPSNVDYELIIKNASGNIIAVSSNDPGIREQLTFQVIKDQLYYIEVIGFSGAYSDLPYTLSLGEIEILPFPAPTGLQTVSFSSSIKLSWEAPIGAISYQLKLNGVSAGNTAATNFTFNNLNPLSSYSLSVAAVYPEGISEFTEIQAATAIPELIVYQPVDFDAAAGAHQLFSFTPASTGVYRIYTGQYGGFGSAEDTELGIYSNQQLTKLIESNDDTNNSVFSEVEVSLVAGQTYYVKVSGFDYSRLQARVTAEVVSSTLPYVQVDQAVDVNQQAGNSNVYIFVPAENGQYRISTSPYNGNVAVKPNDTELSVFSNLNMESPITNGYNDDKGLSVYSEVVVNLTAGNPYYVRITSAQGSKVLARLLIKKAAETSFTALQAGVSVNLQKPAGEEAYYKFTPTREGIYRFFTSAPLGNAQLNDTEISIYSDVRLTNLIDNNDDVIGYRPYGELFSKSEVYLSAGTTYYVVVSSSQTTGLNARFAVENNSQSSEQMARDLAWGESYETDTEGRALQITSLYDADYYRVQLNEPEQVSIYISDGEGSILDSYGNLNGYFGEDGRMNFELAAGVYYLKVEHSAIHDTNQTPSWNTQSFNYELSIFINEIIYTPGTYGETDLLRILPGVNSRLLNTMPEEIKTFDASPGSGGKALVYFQVSKPITKYRVYIETANRMKVNERTINQAYNKGDTIPVEWYGSIGNDNDIQKNLIANSAFIDGFGNHFWAKSGNYDITVFGINGNKEVSGQSFRISVFNDPLNEFNVIPTPPKVFKIGKNEKKITANDMVPCKDCRNYFDRYIYMPSPTSKPDKEYYAWFQDMYGLTGLAKFWKGADALFSCPETDDLLDALNCTLETIGMIPFLGEGADAINGVIYLVKGDYASALLATGSMIPVIGNGFTGAKKFNKMYKYNPCGCLPAGTLVKTQNGDKLIEDIQVGDMVLAKNVDTNIQAYKPVEQLYEFDAEVVYTVDVAGTKIRTTSNHPFWVKGKGWTAADELLVGDMLETEDLAFNAIENISFEFEPTKVYNFTVEDYHTYYISELGFLTHNLLEACRLDKYADVTITVTSKGTNNQKLRAELIKHTKITPPAKWEAHHIIAATHPHPDADKARKILDEYDIDFNSSANGVFLPKEPGSVFTQVDGQTLATHNGGHTDVYFEYVYKKISAAEALGTDYDSKQRKVLEAISQIRNDLLTGVTAIGKVK